MEEANSLTRFISQFFSRHGGLSEPAGEGVVRVLMPEELASELGTEEEVIFGGGEIPLVYGSALLDRMVGKAVSRSPVVYAAITSGYLKKAGFEQILSRDLSFPDCRPVIRATAATRTIYMILTVHYEAVSDEKKDGQVQLALQERSGAEVPGFLEKWTIHHPVFFSPQDVPPHFPRDIGRAMESALAIARAGAEEALKDFMSSMERRLKRDIINTTEYYEALAREMSEGLNHPTLGEVQREERKAKMAALPAEAQRKIEDLRQKYQIRLKIRPSGAVRILTDAVQLMVKVQRGGRAREISIFWNPVTQALDPLVCEACGKTVKRIYCVEQGDGFRLVCSSCKVQNG